MPDKMQEKLHPHPRTRPLERRRSGPERTRSFPYAEFYVTSNFSFLRGASHPEELVQQAAALGYQAIAIADINTLAGVVRADVAARQFGIKLLIGSHLVLHHTLPTKTDRECELIPFEAVPQLQDELLLPCSLLTFPKHREAYGTLSQLLSTGKQRAPKGLCYLTLADLAEHCLAPARLGAKGCEDFVVVVAIHNLCDPTLKEHLAQLSQIFNRDSVAIASYRTYGPDSKRQLDKLTALAHEFSLSLVATNNIYYHIPERRMLQDVLSCIRRGTTLREAGYALFANSERYLKPPQEIYRLFRKQRETIRRGLELAKQVNFSLAELRYEYPQEICPAGLTPTEYLHQLTWEGAATRYPTGIPESVRQQLLHELKLIEELAYEKYFLTVYDIVRFARSRAILCQGRGAAANSAVCYVLGITSVDPSQIRLLVERFISKERNEPPDIDIDFEHERREEVIQYIYQRFGRTRAALVAEVISYRNRSAVRDIGKAFGLSLDLIEGLVKVVTRTDGAPISPEQLQSYGIQPTDPAIQQILNLTETIKGFPRHLSQHVGGFIITADRLDRVVPIENAGMPNRTVIEWDKDDVEALGMLKIDVLALGMLTCIRKGLELLNTRRAAGTPPYELHSIPADDRAVYDMLCRADSIGVFQVESRAQMSMLPRLKPRCFYDLVIEVAIVRPGPIQGGMVHPFLRRRAGKEAVSYPDTRVKAVLERTLGVPIFQEQAMELAVIAAGFTPGEADELRRAMASWKRNKNKLLSFRGKIISGMLSRGYSAEFAESYFQQIQGFGEYGFPQSHAASFAHLVYVSAWLKCHHPAVFAAALINSQPMGFYQPAQIIDDAKRHGVVVEPIDVNYSSWDCTVSGTPPRLRLGLRLIHGLQQREAERITAAIEKFGRQSRLVTLWRRAGVRAQTMKLLANADVFCSFKLSRQDALWEVKRLRDERLPLLEQIESVEVKPALPPTSEVFEMASDYQHTGFSLKSHPLQFIRQSLHQLFEERGVITCAQLRHPATVRGRHVGLAGLVLVRQRPGTANGVVFMTVEDETGFANLVIFSPIFQRYRQTLCDSALIYVTGKVQREDGITHLIVSHAEPLSLDSTMIPEMSRDFH